MKAKKLISLLVVFAVILSLMVPAFAANVAVVEVRAQSASSSASSAGGDTADESKAKISRDEAKAKAKEFLEKFFDFQLDEKIFETRIEFRENYMYGAASQGYLWQIDYNMNTNEKTIGMNVRVDADSGKVVNVNKYEYTHGEEQPVVAAITQEQARATAESFLAKINPEEMKQAVYIDDGYERYGSYYPAQYYFRFVRTVNGIQFDRDWISIGVDGLTGKVMSYDYSWNDKYDFPALDGVISKEKAKEIFAAGGEMVLSYISDRNRNYEGRPSGVKLVYTFDFKDNYLLDAKDGSPLDWNGVMGLETRVKDLTDSEREAFHKKAVSMPELSKELDSSRAAEIMKGILRRLYGEGFEIDSLQYTENQSYWENRGRKAWSAQLRKTEDTMYMTSGNIVIDALTGGLISVRKYDPLEMRDMSEFEPKLTWEEAYTRAIEAIGEYFPDKVKEIKTEQGYIKQESYVNGKRMPERYYYFNFSRLVNGIPYNENSLSVSVDTKTGAIREVYSSWDTGFEFADAQGSISAEEAEKIFFEFHQPELIYTSINKSEDQNKPEYEVKAVYRLKSVEQYPSTGNIDAFTGGRISFTGEKIGEDGQSFKEIIKGHWAEKELGILAYQGIIDTRSFKLDKEITKAEAIKMLMKVKENTYYSDGDLETLLFTNVKREDEIYRSLQLAVKFGVIENKKEEFKGDVKITREEMAELLVKLLQYDKLAKSEEIFNLPFEDAKEVSADKIGYVAIGKGLGILEGSGGKFRPKDTVTMPAFAVALYKTIGN